MTSHKLAIDIDTDNHPQFYISVSDMDLLKSKRTFIACELSNVIVNEVLHVPLIRYN